jgi:type II secretory pathway pseudopilin PulG
MDRNSRTPRQQHGFTIMQMIVTLAIISVVSTVGVLGVKSAREHFKMQNSARLFASYAEKARADSVRRHAASGQEASLEMFGEGTNTYNVTMDFGSGVVETRTFQLDPGIIFRTAAAKVTFDWRGRLLGEGVVFQIESTYLADRIPVDVSGSGDVTIWSQYFPDGKIPEVTVASVGDDVDHGTTSASPSASVSPSPDVHPTQRLLLRPLLLLLLRQLLRMEMAAATAVMETTETEATITRMHHPLRHRARRHPRLRSHSV